MRAFYALGVSLFALALFPINGWSQANKQSFQVEGHTLRAGFSKNGEYLSISNPVISYEVNGKLFLAGDPVLTTTYEATSLGPTTRVSILFRNSGKDTLRLSNVVPFGVRSDRIQITGKGTHSLSRTHLFLPNRIPVNVIVPDNAWELGFAIVPLADSTAFFGLTRREVPSIQKGMRKRFETILYPGGAVTYTLYVEAFKGDWQTGLRLAFQERKLFEVDRFDEELYHRQDLAWIRKAYVMHLMMAWDKDYYDSRTGTFTLPDFVKRGKKIYGGDDVICIWPTWPALGIDDRNQFDLHRDLPGGVERLRSLADTLHRLGTKLFIAYNPWDESTRSEGHLNGLASLLKATGADGVVLDTKGESSKELQLAADAVKPGVVMYSEGMAVTAGMQGIISGRVHNALYYPPMLNLNKLIRPDFSIFRVAEVFKEPIQREYATSLFNGYGTEINQFAPGHPDWEQEQYEYLGRTSRILRENSSVFTGGEFTPLLETLRDSIWVNRWQSNTKTLFTIFSRKPEGYYGLLFKVIPRSGYHFVSLWNHELLEPKNYRNGYYLHTQTASFDQRFLGTNNEGEVDAIAEFPKSLTCRLDGNLLTISMNEGEEIHVYAGAPSYAKKPLVFREKTATVNLQQAFGRFEGKVVIQAVTSGELVDETVVFVVPGTPRMISQTETANKSAHITGMIQIPAGRFKFHGTQGDDFIPYPKQMEGMEIDMSTFWMDRYPVTNAEFKRFMDATHYAPRDTTNFLKHFIKGEIPKGQERFPVVYVCYEDAKAYAKWAGKRLPSELEWQYAAQTSKGNEWPWKQEKPVTRKEQVITETLTVSNIEGIDPKVANLGDGYPYPVGKYSKGVNPFGLYDLVGCVWQLTNDEYESGSYRYVIMKGGSFYKPSSSWWYVQGGPRELHYRQFLLRVSSGFERNGTVGFRCVAD